MARGRPAIIAYPAEDAYVVSVGGTDLTTASAGGAWSFGNRLGRQRRRDFSGPYSDSLLAKAPGRDQREQRGVHDYIGTALTLRRTRISPITSAPTRPPARQTNMAEPVLRRPLWAGYLALVNQQAVANGDAALGFINPLIYPLGLWSSYNTDFHDITSGSNGYPAVTGYDLVTGWGSPNGAGLINALAGTSSSPNLQPFCLAQFGLRGTGE